MVGESRSQPHRRIHTSIHPSMHSHVGGESRVVRGRGAKQTGHVEEVGTRAMTRLDFTGMSGPRWQNSRSRLARKLVLVSTRPDSTGNSHPSFTNG